MADMRIETALISVSDKTGLDVIARFLAEQKVHILSTGGTAKFLRSLGLTIEDVSDYTGFPEILDGRVKTLHPKVHGGILAERKKSEHSSIIKEHEIRPIDLLITNLYPFESTVADGADFATCIENIDIGGPSMIRSAAKNHSYVTVVTHPSDYTLVIEEMKAHKNTTTDGLRKSLAAKAFARTAEYDTAIARWFQTQEKDPLPATFLMSGSRVMSLRYGENPHQSAALYADHSTSPSVAKAKQLQGKELSYNNLVDAEAAFALASEFHEPACAIIKHANPCGVAIDSHIVKAYEKALACDPISAYGGILAINQPVTKELVEALGSLFLEVIVAPSFLSDAVEVLAKKKNLRLLATGGLPQHNHAQTVKVISGGFLVQDKDYADVEVSALKFVTKRHPSPEELDEMRFAFRVCKHVASNAIVITQNRASIGIGPGQTSRIDSTHIATGKAKKLLQKNLPLALASDAFFPFADNVEIAAKAGITSIIQPGGSIRDEEVIAEADKYDIAMVFTGVRHFKH